MIIDNSVNLSRDEINLLLPIFEAAQEIVKGASRLKGVTVANNVLYMKKLLKPGYLAISPLEWTVFNVNDALEPVPGEFLFNPVEIEHLELITKDVALKLQ